MKIPVKICQTKDNKYRAACQSLPGCVVTAESYEDAETRVQQAVESYLASLDVVHPVRLEVISKSALPAKSRNSFDPAVSGNFSSNQGDSSSFREAYRAEKAPLAQPKSRGRHGFRDPRKYAMARGDRFLL